jgi:hypothetical protein
VENRVIEPPLQGDYARLRVIERPLLSVVAPAEGIDDQEEAIPVEGEAHGNQCQNNRDRPRQP